MNAPEMHALELSGCVPDRLLGYLAALGVLRVVARQADPAARGAWQGNAFVLTSMLDQSALEAFLLREYQPSPLVMPWNSGAFSRGKEDSAAGEALRSLIASTSPRLQSFRDTIARTQEVVRRFEQIAAHVEEKERKQAFLRHCRNELPDDVVDWIDATIVLTTNGRLDYPPLLGVGGSDGRMDFTSNYMQRLSEALPEDIGALSGHGLQQAVDQTVAWLHSALLGEGDIGLSKGAVGQFDPGSAGGPNATSGFAAASAVNPWQFILGLEGTLLLASAATRRLRAGVGGYASIPFTVRPLAVGYATAAQAEIGNKSRAELWLPLWDRGWTLPETEQVFNEGRLSVGRQQAANSIDAARSIARLGVDRGIDAFLRYAFLQRSGNAYFAVCLGRLQTPRAPRARVGLLDEIAGWHDSLRRLLTAGGASHQMTLRGLEAAMYRFTQLDDAAGLLALLAAIGRAEQAAAGLAARAVQRDRAARVPRPLQGLSARWVPSGRDATVRIALALAGITAEGGKEPIPALRAHLEPVAPERGGWGWVAEDRPTVVWGGGDLVRDLCAILERRMTEALQREHSAEALSSRVGVTEDHIAAFLARRVDDRRLADLLWAFCGLSERAWAELGRRREPAPARDAALPPNAYALLKLALLPGPPRQRLPRQELPWLWQLESPPFEPRIAWLLRAGRVQEALALAGRRLRIAGLPPLATDFLDAGDPAGGGIAHPAERGRHQAAGGAG